MTTPFPFVASQVLTAQQLNDIQNLPISDKTASYVLIAGDETKRTIMNAAGATTITVNNSIFTVGDVIQVANKGAGACTITAGAGVTINTSGSLALAQYGGGYLLALSASTFTFFNLGGGSAYGAATGGSSSSITVDGINYTLLTFTSTGTLTVTKAGFFDYLIIGGGSGSNIRNDSARANGGGGAAAVLCGTIYLAANQTITIGAGGSFVNYGTTSVGSSTLIGAAAPYIAVAGGSIASWATKGQASGLGNWGNDATSNTFDTGLGFNGGISSSANAAGGGGGFTSAGVAGAAAATTGAAGGTGFDMSTFIGGTPTPSHRATGGGGGGSVAGGAGGNSSASSNAGSTNSTPSSAAVNSGSGGGGGFGVTQTTGNGASGIAMIRFK